MERLERHHHQIILLVLMLFILFSGTMFGMRLAESTRGTQGMDAIMFALQFLEVVVLFLIFMQLLRVRDDMFKRKVR
jgi:uncharacterized membrane protein